MTIELTCPRCHRRLAIRTPKPGMFIHCPVCTGVLTVPETSAEPKPQEPSPSSWWLDHPDNPSSPTQQAVRPRWDQLIDRRVLAGAALAAVLLVLGLLAGAVRVSQPPMPSEALFAVEEPVKVELALAEIEGPSESLPSDSPPAGLLGPVAEEIPVPQFVPQRAMMEKWPVAAERQDEVPAQQPAPPPEKPLVIKRLDRSTDEDLRKQLMQVREVHLDPPGRLPRSGDLARLATSYQDDSRFTPRVLAYWHDLEGLPFRMGADCCLGKDPAEDMQAMSRKLRTIMADSMAKRKAASAGGVTVIGTDNRLDADYMAEKIAEEGGGKEFARSGAVPCLMQMLQPENKPVRQVLVQQLAKIRHRSASEALAKLAVFELADEVRDEAIAELAKRPREEYRPVLLAGLRHLWPTAANHAAEALVAVQDKEAAPALHQLANQPDPAALFFDKSHNAWVPEMVRINHLSNCMMCHAPSRLTTDLVRGRVPSPNQPLPPLTQYYEDNRGPFVRADITYLKQDFSVYQPVDRPGNWPVMQRYDYLVRVRRVETQAELESRKSKPDASYPQREAVLFALKELSR